MSDSLRSVGRCGRRVAVWWVALLASCSAAGLPDFSDIAGEPPLTYSVLVTGGAFVTPGPDPEYDAPMRRTYRPNGLSDEAFALSLVLQGLEAARVFVRAESDPTDARGRARVAASGRQGPDAEPALQRRLHEARERGHDFLLVLGGVDDGRVEYKGINGQWPFTLTAWLLVGLGMLIPDHTYESHAVLQAVLRDVETGAPVMQFRVSGGRLDLPLVQRSDLFGIATSIIVPPFWVGDDDENVEECAREAVTGQLVGAMVRQIKSAEIRQDLRALLPATPDVEVVESGWLVRVDAQESLSFVRLRLDGVALRGPVFDAFERDLLASARSEPGRVLYEALYSTPPAGDRLQVLLQTVTGRVASATIPLAP